MSSRRFSTILRHFREDPDALPEFAGKLSDELLTEVAAELRAETQRRALQAGDREAVIADGFERGFGRDGIARQPWLHPPFLVCPGGLVGRNRHSHRCRFVSVDDNWIWESPDLIHEEKRSNPGKEEGFRAVALLPIVEGMELDVVQGRLRSGQHGVEQVVSYVIRRGQLVEVSQRQVKAHGPI